MAQIIGSDAGDVGLDDLSDFLLECHGPNQGAQTRLECRIGGERGSDRRPSLRMHQALFCPRYPGREDQTRQRSYGHRVPDRDTARTAYRHGDDGTRHDNFDRADEITGAAFRSTTKGPIAPEPDHFDALLQDLVPSFR